MAMIVLTNGNDSLNVAHLDVVVGSIVAHCHLDLLHPLVHVGRGLAELHNNNTLHNSCTTTTLYITAAQQQHST
jgi:hypothetical protein